MSDVAVLDARGLLCPLPVIRTQDRLKSLAPGAELDVLATDPGVLHDIPAWCRVHGHEVVAIAEEGREYRIRVRSRATVSHPGSRDRSVTVDSSRDGDR